MIEKQNFKDVGFYLFLFAGSLGYLISALSLGKPIVNSRISPSFFPMVLGIFSVLISLVLLLKAVKSNKSVDIATKETKLSKYLPILAITSTLIFVLLFQKIGFFASSIPYVFSIILIFSNKDKLFQKLIYSVAITILGYLIFAQIFNVRLPTFLG